MRSEVYRHCRCVAERVRFRFEPHFLHGQHPLDKPHDVGESIWEL